MIGSADRRRWLPLVGATTVLTLALAGCGDDAPAESSIAPTAPTAVTARPSDGSGGDAATTTPITDALSAVGTRYAFTATVTLDGVEVTRVIGTVYDGTGAYLVTAAGSEVEYVASDAGQWARQPGGDWSVLAEAAPLADPLAPLGAPLATTVLDANGDDALVEAVYDGASLGFPSGGEVTVTVTITNGAVSSIAYDALVGDDVATVVTTFDGTADVAPIQVPPT